MSERVKLKSLYLSGFKSFAWSPLREVQRNGTTELDFQGKRVEFGDITVFLGANGAGKSNVVGLFKMLALAMNGELADHVGKNGKASSFLHLGPQVTPRMEIALEFRGDTFTDGYRCILADAAPDALIFTSEVVEYHADGTPKPVTVALGAGHSESKLSQDIQGTGTPASVARVVRGLLQRCKAFQFHDTSTTAWVRKASYVDHSKYLRHDAGNLAAFLLGLRENHAQHYDLVRRTVGSACPQFADFDLVPDDKDRTLFLNWRAKDRPDYLFGPHQLSDGTLRFMALTALLLQPASMKPATIIIDEPELGLHPTAIALLAAMVNQAASNCQVILTTQSPTLVDHFRLEDIRPMAHTAGASTFLAIEPNELAHWLEDYSLGEMWQKNLFRGGPEHV
ncbi:MAG: AAA family ATPase [Planctomycetota bacterium]